MRYQGRITNWKDDRGFGFIAPSGGGDQVFVHISSFVNRSRRPIGDDDVTYILKTDAQGRPQAQAVSFVGDRVQEPIASTAHVVRSLLIAAIFLMVVASLTVVGRLPNAILALYLFASVVAFLAYAWDKLAAQRNAWRTSESTLHLLGLAGGWPGALVARHLFRHKSKKQSFIATFWGIVVLNCGTLAWILSTSGQRFLVSLLGKV